MIEFIQNQLFARPRRLLAATSLACIGLLAFGLLLQEAVGLVPCPMCIVQRYLFILVALAAAIGAAFASPAASRWSAGAMLLLALAGAFVAARQSWLQWFPPEVYSCGRDFYGMIEAFPLKRLIPMVFSGSGDCAAVDWTFLKLSIANWSFLTFSGVALLGAWLLRRR